MANFKNKTVSIISVNYNGGDKIINSIKSVAKQNFSHIEIIVVDNGSKDGSIEKIETLKLKNLKIYKLNKNFGFTYGSNFGITKSRGNYFLILNNDAYLSSSNFIKESVNILNKSTKNTIGIFPKVVFNWENNIINSSFVTWHHKQLWFDDQNGRFDFNTDKSIKQVFGAMFVAPIFKKSLWLKIGGFDNMFFTYGEDFDVSYRANILGYKFLYCPTLKVKHDFRSSSKDDTQPLWSYFYFLRNYLYVIFKNYQTENLIKSLKSYTVFFRSSFKNGLKTKNCELIRLHFKVIFDILKNSKHLIQQRKIIQNQRKKNDNQIWNYDFVTPYNPCFYDNNIVINLDSINE